MNVEAACLRSCLLMLGGLQQERADASIVEGARRGDPSALDELVRRHQNRIYNLAYRMLRQAEDAEDVTQEAFLKAFAALPRLKNDGAFRSWLCRIAANLCLMRLRSRPRCIELAEDATADDTCSADCSDLDAWQVREAVAKLPPKYRLAVVAFYVEGRSYAEGARLAGVPVLTFKTRLYRARKMLRDLLGNREHTP